MYDFQEGEDTAVISLRDDVNNVRAECEAPVENLLYYAGELDRNVVRNTYGDCQSDDECTSGVCNEDDRCVEPCLYDGDCSNGTCLYDGYCGEPGWEEANCAAGEDGESLSCIGAGLPQSNLSGAGLVQNVTEDPTFGAIKLYEIWAGNRDGSECPPFEEVDDPEKACGLTTESALVQRLSLAKGFYRLSWYGRERRDQESPIFYPPSERVVVTNEDGEPIRRTDVNTIEMEQEYKIDAFRLSYDFYVDAQQVITVAIKPPIDDPNGVIHLYIGGFMLENVDEKLSSDLPSIFVSTTSKRTNTLPVCEDTTGKVFRDPKNQYWQRGCVRLCADGLSSDCNMTSAETHCYWETLFNLNQRSIESGDQLVSSGFARGNFNYRLDSIGVNFVGTNIRDCSESLTPSTCYSGGFVPYSLRQEGPYFVRNHMGSDFRVRLFNGNIEHARGLANERYLTNPLSGTDSELIEQYMRSEFQGRPLDGNYILRVWEEPSVNFNSIEDVQIVLKYRYWTRFD